MKELPTPETDAAAEAVGMGHFMVDSDFARKLERERDEAREALVRASLYIVEVTGSCPYDFFDIEPHDYPCSEVCDKYTNDMHLCWKKHFTNKKETK